jgi:hypothetical protein
MAEKQFLIGVSASAAIYDERTVEREQRHHCLEGVSKLTLTLEDPEKPGEPFEKTVICISGKRLERLEAEMALVGASWA